MKSRIEMACLLASLLGAVLGCAGRTDGHSSVPQARLHGTVSGLGFGTTVSAIAGTFWGADDGLDVAVTDADDLCDARTHSRRVPNTSVLVLSYLDATGPTKLDSTSVAHAGPYEFTTAPFGGGRFYRVVRAYHLDANCTATNPADATAGTGSLSGDVSLGGGTAEGQFTVEFAGGSLGGDFVAPFCPGLERSGSLAAGGAVPPGTVAGCPYFSPRPDDGCGCGTSAAP